MLMLQSWLMHATAMMHPCFFITLTQLFASQQELVVLGGAFFCNGNVTPCAEANIIGDTDAADFVLGQSPNIRLVGLDVTHKCTLSTQQMEDLKGQGQYGTFLQLIAQFYLKYHR